MMLFSSDRTILFIDKEKIRWAKGQVPSGKILGVVQEAQCSEENLQLVFSDIIKNFPKKVRIVVGEEFSYVTRFQKNKDNVRMIDEAQPLIPEKLEEGWDSKDSDADNVQIMAVQKQVFSVLKGMLLKNEIELEAMEVESISVSRMVPVEKDKITLVARSDGKILLEAVQNGSVMATRIFFQFPEKEKIQEFLSYVSSQKNVSSGTVFVQDGTGELARIFQELGLSVQEGFFDPLTGICRKKDIDGPDNEVLNIILGEDVKDKEKSLKNKSFGRMTFREKFLLAVFCVIFLAGMVATYQIYRSRQKDKVLVPQTVETR